MAGLALVAASAGLLASYSGLRTAHAGVAAVRLRAPALAMSAGLDRRAALSAALLAAVTAALPEAASAKIDSVNPANNYYFPQVRSISFSRGDPPAPTLTLTTPRTQPPTKSRAQMQPASRHPAD
jgi:hypothetical protein